MCYTCIYKRICGLQVKEAQKTAPDTPCQHYHPIPPVTSADTDPDIYLV